MVDFTLFCTFNTTTINSNRLGGGLRRHFNFLLYKQKYYLKILCVLKNNVLL